MTDNSRVVPDVGYQVLPARMNLHPTSFSRVSDDLVAKRAALKKLPTSPRYQDAGLLMMDCRNGVFLVLCAGHGGAGTLGCVRQLREKALVEALLDEAATENEMPGRRFAAVVDVSRERREESDDLLVVDDLEVVSSTIVWASSNVPGCSWADRERPPGGVRSATSRASRQ